MRASADPTRRPLGETKLRDVTVDRVAAWSQGNEQALAPSMAQLALIALNQVFRYAVRRGWVGVNPVAQLEPGEKPRWRVEHVCMLEGADLAKLLEHAGEISIVKVNRSTECRGLSTECSGLIWL